MLHELSLIEFALEITRPGLLLVETRLYGVVLVVELLLVGILVVEDGFGVGEDVLRLSRATRRTLFVNLGFALFMIALMLVAIFARDLPLPLAVIGHEGGTVLVSLNGLRLLGYRDKAHR